MGRNEESEYSREWDEARKGDPGPPDASFHPPPEPSSDIRHDPERERKEWIRDSIPYWTFLALVLVIYIVFMLKMR